MVYCNEEALTDFWHFINERHKIFLKKTVGKPKPWTDDPILRDWKFCNVFRKYDTQSERLIRNIILPHWNDDLSLMLFNIYAFRAFNWWPTYANLASVMGRSWLDRWNPEEAVSILDKWVINAYQKLTSGAYMIRGREGMPKYESIVQTLDSIWRWKEYFAKWFVPNEINSMQEVQKYLMDCGFWGWGSFTTYQIVLDLTYTKWLENAIDINTWCEFGPGAIRGIREIYPDLPKNMMLQAAKGLLLDSPKFLEGHVPALTLQDVEFVCCELQKYRRIKAGGRSKEKYNGSS